MSSKKNIRKVALSTMAASAAVVSVAPVASAAEEKAPSFPDVNKGDTHYEGIMALAEAGILGGYENGQFGVWDKVNRNQVASIFKRALDLKVPANKEEVLKVYSDVNSKTENSDDIAAVTAAGIFQGTNGKFNQWSNLTREQMASVIVRAFDLKKYNDDKEDVKINLDNVSPVHKDNVQILANFGITDQLNNFRPNESIERGAFATFTHRSQNVVKEEEFKRATPVVEGATAVDSTTIKLTGTGLQNLKAEDVSVSNSKITYVKASEDGTSAEVKVDAALVPDAEYTVSVKSGDETKEFKVSYSLVTKTATVDAKSYDYQKADQYVSFQINGKAGSVEDLKLNGYTVEFSAVDSDGNNATNDIFADTTTGKLKSGIKLGTYKVQLTVSKGSDVIVSPQAEIKIENFNVIASAINSYKFENSNNTVAEQKSNNLLVGETASLKEVNVTQNSADKTLKGAELEDAIKAGKLEVKSADEAVASVATDTTNGTIVLSANTPGSAKVTITYGNITKDITIKVSQASEERKVSKVEADTNSAKVLKGKSNTFKVTAYDQYGDILKPADGDIVAKSVNKDTATVETAGLTFGNDNKAEVQVNGVKVGSTSISFENTKGKVLGTVGVSVTENASVATTKLEVKKDADDEKRSDDTTINQTGDKDSVIVFELNSYTKDGVKVESKDFDDYDLKYDEDIIKVSPNGKELTVTASDTDDKKAGTTDLVLFDKADGTEVARTKVSVVDNATKITSIDFKNVPAVTYAGKEIDYKTVLNVEEYGGNADDVVNGVKLNKSTGSPIRITEDGDLYIDANGNGTKDAKEDSLGKLTFTAATGKTGLELKSDNPVKDAYTTIDGDKGTIIFTVVKDKQVLDKVSISVNVPGKAPVNPGNPENPEA